MSPVWQAHVVDSEGHPGSAQQVVPANAVGSQGTDGDCAADEGSNVHEQPSQPALQLTVIGVASELHATVESTTIASRDPSVLPPATSPTSPS